MAMPPALLLSVAAVGAGHGESEGEAAGVVGGGEDIAACGAYKEGMHLRQCFYVSVTHDGIHPSIMNRNQAMPVSFRIGRGYLLTILMYYIIYI